MGRVADADGNVFIADTGNNRIRRVTPMESSPVVVRITTFYRLTVDQNGTLFIVDSQNGVIRRVAPDGSSSIIAGGGTPGLGDGGPAPSAELGAFRVATDRAGDIFVMGGASIRKISPDGITTTLAGATSGIYSAGFSGASA